MRDVVGDVSGSLADLGVMIPIVAALVLKNHFDAGTVLVCVGSLYIAAGLYFRVPVPVQPIKAAAAIAIAQSLPPVTLSAAGLLIGLLLLVAVASRAVSLIERVFTKPIVRGIQLGVGLVLIRAAFHLDTDATVATYVVGALVAASLLVAQRWRQLPAALVIVSVGIVWTLLRGADVAARPGWWHPQLAGLFHGSTLVSALVLLVIPQIPLTLGNAVIALSDVEHRYFGERAARVSPATVSVSCGVANIAAALLGGMPMCHGSGGLTAHHRAGARTNLMNFAIGGGFLVLGLRYGPAALGLLGLIPSAVLIGLLGFTGAMHALLAADLRRIDLAIAAAMGAIGLLTSNLALALGAGIALVGLRTAIRRRAGRKVLVKT